MINQYKWLLFVCLSTLIASTSVHAEEPENPNYMIEKTKPSPEITNAITFKPLSLLYSLIHGRWESALTKQDTIVGGFGFGLNSSVFMTAFEGGYRRYVTGSFSDGMLQPHNRLFYVGGTAVSQHWEGKNI